MACPLQNSAHRGRYNSILVMFLFIFQCVVVGVVGWISWLILSNIFFRSNLDNIPGPPSKFLIGNLGQIHNQNDWGFHKHLAEDYGGGVVKVGGLLGERQLYVFDPHALHHIFVKEQSLFQMPPIHLAINRLIFGNGLISTVGGHHRKQRKMLNPLFSSAHLRAMVPMFNEIAEKVRNVIKSKVNDGPQEVEMMHWAARVGLEAIGQAGLGFSFDPLTDDEQTNPYAKSIKELPPAMYRLSVVWPFLPTLLLIPLAIRRILLCLIPLKSAHELKDLVNTMDQQSRMVFEERKKAAMKGEGQDRQDIMSTLLKANMNTEEHLRLPDSELVDQMNTFTVGATDTTSSVLSQVLHLLSQHPDIQGKLRCEIVEARKNNNRGYLNYDELSALPFLDAVTKETLRLHPPLAMMGRSAIADSVLPLSVPIRGIDGTMITSIPILKNTTIMISTIAANRNKVLWGEDALEWKPERWLNSAGVGVGKGGVKLPGVYSNMMTFSAGEKACIGFKLAQLEIKLMLFHFLEWFKFTPTKKEVKWTLSSVSSPTVDGEPQLPLNVEFVG